MRIFDSVKILHWHINPIIFYLRKDRATVRNRRVEGADCEVTKGREIRVLGKDG